MLPKTLITHLASLLLSGVCINFSSATEIPKPIGTQVADAIIARYQPTIDVLTHHGWDHSNSIVLHGIEKIYLHNKNAQYLDYIKNYADDYINADGSINGLLTTLDGMHPGVVCLFLYQQTGEDKYRLAAQTMRNHLLGSEKKQSAFNKTPDGGYWHKNDAKYKNVVSVDGLYMKDPFLVRYGVMFNEPNTINAALEQVLLVAQRSFNIRTNLAFHAWSYDKSPVWADPITGQANQHWSRASGWFAMALVDILEHLPKDHTDYSKITYLYQRLAQGIKAAQNPANGLWYQVLDAYNQPDNYPEISSSGMMVYALQKGVELKLLPSEYSLLAKRGWQGMQTYIKTYADGGPQITSVAPGMSSQTGYQAYVDIKPISVPSTEPIQYSHGYIGVLMAASVMETFEHHTTD